VLDYYEAVGQVLATHVNWLRSNGYGKALIVLPHDGVNENNITGKRYEDHLRDAGFEVEVVENQGKGAAAMRIEAARRIFPKVLVQRDDHGSGPRCAWAITTSARTKRATSGLVPSMIGQAMLRMVWADGGSLRGSRDRQAELGERRAAGGWQAA
jgi:hypothetical protein